MIIPRRKFLNLLGVAAGTAGLGGCNQPWSVPDRLVELALRGPGLESEVQTVCGLCEGGCGLSVRMVDGLPVGLKGNPNHPLNRGGLCPVGQSGLEILYAPDRLQYPMRRGAEGEYDQSNWDAVLKEIALRLQQLRETGEQGRIAMLTGEHGSLFQGLASQFMFTLGSPNLARVEDNGTLPFILTQGIDEVPGFDLSRCDLVLSFGLDLYEDGASPMHAIAAMIGTRSTENRASSIHVGSRLSPSAGKAEQYIPVQPGTYAAFALGVAHVLVREGRYDQRFVAENTFGFEDWTDEGRRHTGFRRLLLEHYYPDRVAQICGCTPRSVVRTARRFAEASKPVALAGGEATRCSNATSNVMAVHSLNALVGAFDRPGGVTLAPEIPLTPLPDTGKLASDKTRSVFEAGPGDVLLGFDSVEALANCVLDESHGIEVLFVVGSNPVHESPAGSRLIEAMDRIPMVVALTSFMDETSEHAHIILPTHVFLEGWQASTTPTATAISVLGISEPVVEPLFDTRHAGDVLLELGQRAVAQESDVLPWTNFSDYLKNRLEGLAISGQGSIITGSFEESWRHFLEERGWRFLEHKNLEDFWNDLVRQAGWWNPVQSRGNWARLFRTPSGRYEFFSQELQRRLVDFGASEGEALSEEQALQRALEMLQTNATVDEICLPHYEPPREEGEGELSLIPFRPLTARGSMGVRSPMVLEMFGYPVLTGWQTWAELCPETAHELGVGDGDHVALESDRGSIEAVVRVQHGPVPQTVHVPLGLGHKVSYRTTEMVGANPVDILSPVNDPLTGSLSLNSTRVRIRLLRRRPHGEPLPIHTGGPA